jgi:hypothetical protein
VAPVPIGVRLVLEFTLGAVTATRLKKTSENYRMVIIMDNGWLMMVNG